MALAHLPPDACPRENVLARGAPSQASVYPQDPRELAKRVLKRGVAHVILAQRHPRGQAEASRDVLLSGRAPNAHASALALVSVRVIDRPVATRGQTISVAERGFL